MLEIDSEMDNEDKDLDLASIQRRKKRRKLRRLQRKRLALEHRQNQMAATVPTKSPPKSPLKHVSPTKLLPTKQGNIPPADQETESKEPLVNAVHHQQTPTTSAAAAAAAATQDECTTSLKGI